MDETGLPLPLRGDHARVLVVRLPMDRYPQGDALIPDADGIFEAYRCSNGHYDFEPFD